MEIVFPSYIMLKWIIHIFACFVSYIFRSVCVSLSACVVYVCYSRSLYSTICHYIVDFSMFFFNFPVKEFCFSSIPFSGLYLVCARLYIWFFFSYLCSSPCQGDTHNFCIWFFPHQLFSLVKLLCFHGNYK